jgi:hypothetical protein
MTTTILTDYCATDGTKPLAYEQIKAAYRNGSLGQLLATLSDDALIQTAHAHLWALRERGKHATLTHIGQVYGQLMSATLPEGTAITRDGQEWLMWHDGMPIGVARSWRDGAATLWTLADEIALEQARLYEPIELMEVLV